MALWRHGVTSDDVFLTWQNVQRRLLEPIRIFGNHIFQPGDLDLWPWLITVNASTKSWVRMSDSSSLRALTNRQTQIHQTDSHTLDRWRGREWNPAICSCPLLDWGGIVTYIWYCRSAGKLLEFGGVSWWFALSIRGVAISTPLVFQECFLLNREGWTGN